MLPSSSCLRTLLLFILSQSIRRLISKEFSSLFNVLLNSAKPPHSSITLFLALDHASVSLFILRLLSVP
nr:MAG TPA: hypothetical protein [Caudoviricetes sp.]